GVGVLGEGFEEEGGGGAVGGGSAQEACAGRARRDGGRQRVQHVHREGEGDPGRDRLCDRRLAAHRRPQRAVQERTQSECRPPVPELLLLAGGAAALHRRRRIAFVASADQGEARSKAVWRDQEDERRSRGGGKVERRDQGALQQTVRGVGRQSSRLSPGGCALTPLQNADRARPRGASRRAKWPAPEQEETMRERRFSRRDVLKASTVAAAGLFAAPSRGAAPEATAITPDLVEAARKEGRVNYYTSIDLPLAEKIARSFEAAFPGVSVRVERSGPERGFQRIGLEYASRIYGVDGVNSSDAAHFIVWKRDGLLVPFVPADVAKHYPAEHKDPDGMFASFRVSLSAVAYNTDLVKREEAPTSFADLLDPKWTG